MGGVNKIPPPGFIDDCACHGRVQEQHAPVPVPISRAYMGGLCTDQNSTPYIKRWENQQETQLSVMQDCRVGFLCFVRNTTPILHTKKMDSLEIIEWSYLENCCIFLDRISAQFLR